MPLVQVGGQADEAPCACIVQVESPRATMSWRIAL